MHEKEQKWIPLSQLKVSPYNVRKVGMLSQKEYNEMVSHTGDISMDYRKLKPSIQDVGIITDLVVLEKNGFYEIAKGQRRYLAFKELYEEGKITSDKMPCIVKVLDNPAKEAEEIATEELIEENTKMALGDNYRDAFQTVMQFYKDSDKVAHIFAISREEVERQFQHYDVLNPHANANDFVTMKKPNNIPNQDASDQVFTTHLSHEETQYYIRWNRENPSLTEKDVKTWFKETGLVQARVKTVLIHALSDYAKDQKISFQTALERFLYEELKRFLREKRFYAEQEE